MECFENEHISRHFVSTPEPKKEREVANSVIRPPTYQRILFSVTSTPPDLLSSVLKLLLVIKRYSKITDVNRSIIRLGQTSTAFEALRVESPEVCSLEKWLALLQEGLARGDVSSTLQVVRELARGISQDSSPSAFGVECLAVDRVAISERLFAVLEALHEDDRLLLQHAQVR